MNGYGVRVYMPIEFNLYLESDHSPTVEDIRNCKDFKDFYIKRLEAIDITLETFENDIEIVYCTRNS